MFLYPCDVIGLSPVASSANQSDLRGPQAVSRITMMSPSWLKGTLSQQKKRTLGPICAMGEHTDLCVLCVRVCTCACL